MADRGRPTEYSDEILVKAKEYLNQTEDEEEQQLVGMSAKGTELYKNKLKVNLPTIEGLAIHLGIHRDTVYDWEKATLEDGETLKYPVFSDIIGVLRAKQANNLINKGLSGDYNPTIAKLLLSKHGYKEQSDVTSGDKPINGVVMLPQKNEDTLATSTEAGESIS